VVGEAYKSGDIPDAIRPWCSHIGIRSQSREGQFEEEQCRVTACQLIVTTTCTAGGNRFSERGFDSIIVDEANQLVDPEFAILLVFDPQIITLYGDEAQIGPFVGSRRAAKLGYGKSLIQRLAEIVALPQRIHGGGTYAHFLLSSLYRMHPALAEFPSREFYRGKVDSSPDRSPGRDFGLPFPNPRIPMVFVNVPYGREQNSGDGNSYLNIGETLSVANILIGLREAGVPAESIGVITFYAAAVDAANELLPKLVWTDEEDEEEWLENVEIGTVDSYEGREKDYVILMCVRSNDAQKLGFLCDTGRMNVALTRARNGLLVVGNLDTLKSPKSGSWHRFVEHCQKQGVIVEQWPPS
jgi:regulator of nonsense transcripts 1